MRRFGLLALAAVLLLFGPTACFAAIVRGRRHVGGAGARAEPVGGAIVREHRHWGRAGGRAGSLGGRRRCRWTEKPAGRGACALVVSCFLLGRSAAWLALCSFS